MMVKRAGLMLAIVVAVGAATAATDPAFQAKYDEGKKYLTGKDRDPAKAEKLFKEALALATNDAERGTAHLYIGHALGGQDKNAEAVEHLKKVTELEGAVPSNISGAYYTMAGDLMAQKKTEEARQALEDCIEYPKANPTHVMLARLSLAGIETDAKNFDKAMELYNAVLDDAKADDNTRARTQWGIGLCYRAQDKPAQAITAFEEGLRYPKASAFEKARLQYYMASTYAQTGNKEAARDAYEKLMDMKAARKPWIESAENYLKANK